MFGYLKRRIFTSILVLILVPSVTFLIQQAIPGDPSESILGVDADPFAKEAFRNKIGYNDPVAVKYVTFWKSIVIDWTFGISWRYETPIIQKINEKKIWKLINKAPSNSWLVLEMHALDGEGLFPWPSDDLERLKDFIINCGFSIKTIGEMVNLIRKTQSSLR